MDVVEQILDESAKFCAEVLAPLNSVGDKQGCVWHPDNTVTTPPGFKEAYQPVRRGRLAGAGAAVTDYGGQGLPAVVAMACERDELVGQHGLLDVRRA